VRLDIFEFALLSRSYQNAFKIRNVSGKVKNWKCIPMSLI
jgi:hypothetical protein